MFDLSKNFFTDLISIAQDCNEHNTNECELEIKAPYGSVTVRMIFTYDIQEGIKNDRD